MDIRALFESIDAPLIIYEDDDFAVAAKPSGMHCTPHSDSSTLSAWLYKRRPSAATVRGRGEGGILHRLDFATAGLVVFALHDAAFAAAESAASKGEFSKSYMALCECSDAGLEGSKPLALCPPSVCENAWRNALRTANTEYIAAALNDARIISYFRPYGRGAARVACADINAQLSCGKQWTKTRYTTHILSARSEKKSILMRAELARGFRHQIRAHAAWLGLPLEGDSLYGEGGTALRLLAYEVRLSTTEKEIRVLLPHADIK